MVGQQGLARQHFLYQGKESLQVSGAGNIRNAVSQLATGLGQRGTAQPIGAAPQVDQE